MATFIDHFTYLIVITGKNIRFDFREIIKVNTSMYLLNTLQCNNAQTVSDNMYFLIITVLLNDFLKNLLFNILVRI